MIAFQFPTQVTPDGDLAIPSYYLHSIPPGSQLQVVLLVDSPEMSLSLRPPLDTDRLSLEGYVESLRQQRPMQIIIDPPSNLLGDHLAHPLFAADPDFDEAFWNEQWDLLEARIEADESTDEQARLHSMMLDLQP